MKGQEKQEWLVARWTQLTSIKSNIQNLLLKTLIQFKCFKSQHITYHNFQNVQYQHRNVGRNDCSYAYLKINSFDDNVINFQLKSSTLRSVSINLTKNSVATTTQRKLSKNIQKTQNSAALITT